MEHAWQDFRRLFRKQHHSELYQDVFVLFATQLKMSGFFVEFGAMDGVRASNTLLLEREFGWQGILSEPNPRYNDKIPANRQAVLDRRCVSDRSGDMVQFQTASIGGYPGMVGHIYHEARSRGDIIEVETVSLNDLLTQHQAPHMIDYISVDTDGSEPLIMQAFDFSQHQVQIWSIEHNREPWREDIHRIMQDHDYTRVLVDHSGYDDWYVCKQVLEDMRK